MNGYFEKTTLIGMTIIEIAPFRNGWKYLESPWGEPVFLNQGQVIDYAKDPSYRSVGLAGSPSLDYL